MFELCEAKSGYVYNLDVYTGAFLLEQPMG
jgi:hypothetical protein